MRCHGACVKRWVFSKFCERSPSLLSIIVRLEKKIEAIFPRRNGLAPSIIPPRRPVRRRWASKYHHKNTIEYEQCQKTPIRVPQVSHFTQLVAECYLLYSMPGRRKDRPAGDKQVASYFPTVASTRSHHWSNLASRARSSGVRWKWEMVWVMPCLKVVVAAKPGTRDLILELS